MVCLWYASGYSAVVENFLLPRTLLSHVSRALLVLQIGQANMYASYWSLPSVRCRQLLKFRHCSSLRCTFQAPFPFQFMQDADMKYYLAPVSQSGAIAFSCSIHAVLHKEFPAETEMVQAGLAFTCIFACLCMGCAVCKSCRQLVCFALIL